MKPTKEELIRAINDLESAVKLDSVDLYRDFPVLSNLVLKRDHLLYLVECLYTETTDQELDYNSTWSCC